MIRDLQRSHASRFGVPVIQRVDTAIFMRRYFARCMACTFCNDQCCSYGVDVDLENKARIDANADEIERFTGVPRESFFTGEVEVEPEYPGGGCTRTRTDARGCVFLRRDGRGCGLHAYALARGLDYHLFKPMMSSLFPVTFSDGLLTTAEEVDEGSLACLDRPVNGPSLYDGVREELGWYFGAPLVAELDVMKMTRALRSWGRE